MNEIKLSPWSAKMLKQLPDKQRVITKAILQSEIRDTVRVSVDTILMAAILAGVEEGFWGTWGNATRIPRFVARVNKIVDTTVDRYDDAVAEGLRAKLHSLGVEYGRD